MLLACPVLALSQELTLDQAISLALQKNRQVKVAQLEVEKSEHDTEVMRTYRLPEFKLNTMQGQLLTKVTFTFPPGSLGAFPGIGPISTDDHGYHHGPAPVYSDSGPGKSAAFAVVPHRFGG
jgi:hypothetical protein